MSRLFSITSSTSEATMLSAATMTISPMVIEIAIFSSHSAEKSDLFMSAQSCVVYSVAELLGNLRRRPVCAANMSSSCSWMKSGWSCAESAARRRRDRRSAVLAVELVEPEAERARPP